MTEEERQKLEDLEEFIQMLDFKKKGDKIIIVSNEFDKEEIPATVQVYLKNYFRYIASIK